MQDALLPVIVVVVAVSVVVAVVALAGSGRVWDQVGRGGLSLRDGGDRPADEGSAQPSGASARERDEEVRQLLGARNARRLARGQPALDVEAELARLTAGVGRTADPALRAEVRQLVQARNARRARRGQPPLDVEAEVERQLKDLGAG